MLSRAPKVVALVSAAVSALLTMCSPAAASPVSPDVSQYAHASWTIAAGFAEGAIQSIAQTPDGYLWLGTEFGLLRFDGIRTTPWPSDRMLPSTQVRALISSRDGTLWIGTSKGLASWKDSQFTSYAELAGRIVSDLLEDREGTVWVRAITPAGSRLCAIRTGAVRCWGEEDEFGSRITTMYEDVHGNLWFGATHGLWQWNEGQPTFHPLTIGESVQAFSEDADGALLVIQSRLIQKMVSGRFQEAYRLPRVMTRTRVLRDRDAGVWIGSIGGGLVHLQGGRVDQFSSSDGLSSDSVAALFQDREGSIWIGTHAGLDRFRELSVTPFTPRQGFSNLRILSVLASRDGSVWARTADGVNQWRDGRVTVYPEFTDLTNRKMVAPLPSTTAETAEDPGVVEQAGGSLFEDERGRIWFSGTQATGYIDHGQITPVSGVPGGRVHAITGDLKGNIWLAHENGLFHLIDDCVIEHLSWSRLHQTSYADALALDPVTGGLWLGFFNGGIELLKDGEIRSSYSAANDLPAGRVNDLRVDRAGALWAATEGGVSRIVHEKFATLSSRDGLPCNEAHWTIEDDAGDVWVSMPCGLVRIGHTELQTWENRLQMKQPPPWRIPLTVLDSSDGVRTRANAGPFSPHAAKARDGRLWFFPLEGLNALDPRRLSLNALPPPVHVEEIDADGRVYSPMSEVSLPPLIRNLRIDYTALSLAAPGKVRFRTRLEGREGEWQDVGSRRQAFYNGLAPGKYRFRVMASNNNGVWNEAGAFVDFSVAPVFYQTTWFLALSVVAAATMVWAAHRVRIRIVEKHEREISALNQRLMNAQEQERIHLAGELHDGVMQEMLAATMMLGSAKRRMGSDAAASATLEKIQDKLIRVGTDIRLLSHELHPPMLQHMGLPQAVLSYCEQFSTTSGVAMSCDTDENASDLSRGAALALFRILQEALGNTAKYAKATRVVVRLSRTNGEVWLTVADDGIGFDQGRGQSSGLGLITMRERANQLNGSFEFDSAPGRGTTIRIVIPFR